MNIVDLAERVTADRGVDKEQAKRVIEAALMAVADAAIAQRSVDPSRRASSRGRCRGHLARFGEPRIQDRRGASLTNRLRAKP